MAFLISGLAGKITYQEEICQKVNSFCVQPAREESIVIFGRLFKHLAVTAGPTPECRFQLWLKGPVSKKNDPDQFPQSLDSDWPR